ncbi:endonuclease III [Alkaliphilus metalliredigens QYMF]|uniref:Endonuclease III n=1 Tax=Alkaliphilus metalliredigens (strain QYMF) TaxID=293826 RepID=A6TU82_ALKMQ|nr:endonuclease III [Alkaliphilus metalliredigens]ABR49750.1 endonuclease III [Alkaliphilus metalliredigens QYMF]
MRKIRLNKEERTAVLAELKNMYPNAESELNFRNPFELLISTILAAQCTDKRVNQVTKPLFEKYPTPERILTLTEVELGQWIKSCGFYNMKSKNILATCHLLMEKHGGEVPEEREALMALPGVGRKTANVVISNVFGQDAIAVDTHVFRVSNRLGLAHSDNVDDTEQDLMKSIPKSMWSDAHHWIILHGRRICKARRPLCEECPLTTYCLHYKKMST